MNCTRAISALLCVALVHQPLVALAQDTPAATTPAKPVVRGQLLDLDGKTPWVGKVVRVVERTSLRLVAEPTSDEGGRFELPALEPGEYLVVVGSLVSALTVLKDRPVRDLRIVASRDQVVGETIPMADLTPTVTVNGTTLIVMGVIVVVVGVVAVGGMVAGYNLRKADDDEIWFIPAGVSPFLP